MCGISGYWGASSHECVETMNAQLRHRGPDGVGKVTLGIFTLGHCRLAIMDPDGGQQPLIDGNSALVVNGEIYNWRDLRTSLNNDALFKTTSDSEVPLHLLRSNGMPTFERLDGMYALAYTDGDELILGRDPIGIKPLYYSEKKTREGNRFQFASEMKALQEDGVSLKTLAPGSSWSSKSGFKQHYELPPASPQELPETEAIKRVRETLETATRKRLMSDVPLGAFLSGGLDSSITAALAIKELGSLHTFSVGLEDSTDLVAARHVAKHIGSTHHEYLLDPAEIRRDLPNIIYHLESFDEDLMVSAIPCYYVSKLAAEHVKVVLTGEGADELFAGYKYYQDYDNAQALNEEMRRGLSIMHSVNLQRVDRMTMAHGLEGRVPFLDTEMIRLGFSLPLELKLKADTEGKLIEKWVLRKAFEDLLPETIVWRTKSRFDEGTGTLDLMDAVLGDWADIPSLETVRASYPEAQLRTAQEAFYFEQFQDVFTHPELLLSNTGRWASDRVS